MRKRDSLEERLNRYTNKGDPDDCWPWTAGTAGKGYGVLKVWSGSKWITGYAHRETLRLHQSEPEYPNNQVLHSCDNPICCNPKHLSWGSNSKNRKEARDRLHNQGNQKLTPDQVDAIRNDPRIYQEIANDYSLHRDTVARIKQKRAWLSI